MNCDNYIIENCQTLASFEALEANQQEPKLAVWRGKKLVIVSSNQDNPLTRLVKKIFYFIFQGLLTHDVAPLKEKITQYVAHKASEYNNILAEKIKELETKLSTGEKSSKEQDEEIKTKTIKLENLTQAVAKIAAEEKELITLRDNRREAEQELNSTLAEEKRLIASNENRSKELKNLNERVKSLHDRYVSFEYLEIQYEQAKALQLRSTTQNGQLNNEINRLKETLIKLQAEKEQLKARNEALAQRCSTTERK